MAIIDVTPKGANANSYATVADGTTYLAQSRLYSDAWDAAAVKIPDADGFLVNNGGGYAVGIKTVTVDAGTGTAAKGEVIKFGGHATLYELTSASTLTGMSFTPGLSATVADNEAVNRVTANPREASLIWATSLLDGGMQWNGSKRDIDVQVLRWPRSGVTDLDNDFLDFDTIPALLRDITVERALSLLERNRVQEPELFGLGMSKIKVEGSVDVQVDEGMVLALIPDYIITKLLPLGVLDPSAAGVGSGTVRLSRG